MSSSKSIDKLVRVAERKRLRNRLVQSNTRTRIKKAASLIGAGELTLAQQEVTRAISSIDKAVAKRVIHKNKGANLKSQLSRKLNAAVVGQSSERGEEETGQSEESGG